MRVSELTELLRGVCYRGWEAESIGVSPQSGWFSETSWHVRSISHFLRSKWVLGNLLKQKWTRYWAVNSNDKKNVTEVWKLLSVRYWCLSLEVAMCTKYSFIILIFSERLRIDFASPIWQAANQVSVRWSTVSLIFIFNLGTRTSVL